MSADKFLLKPIPLLIFVPVEFGVKSHSGYTLSLQRLNLIINQRNKGRNHNGVVRQQQSRYLIAQRLAFAGFTDTEGVFLFF